MRFHTFGDKKNEAVVLIHGMLTPWQMWDYQADKLKDSFYVVIPALDGHTSEESSEFISVEKEAEEIENYIINELGGHVRAVCGISMGGVITGIIWKNNRIRADRIIMDGAPFARLPSLAVNIMTKNYIKLLRLSKQRDPKTLEGFSKNLLPEKYLPDYLAFIDKMTESSVTNAISSVFAGHYPENVDDPAKVMFMHGTKANESVAAKAAKRLKNDYPDIKIICRQGHVHCENALFHPDKWYDEVKSFLYGE